MRLSAFVFVCLWATLSFTQAARAELYLTDSAVATDEGAAGDACVSGSCVPDPCECCDCFCGKRVLGFLPSDHCFDSFISPLSNPFFFEDPRSLTEARGIFIDNSLPNGIGGGDGQVWAGQLRGRVTERWSVIAPRLASLQVNQAGNPTGNLFLSAPVGVKYNFIRDVERQLLVSAGLTYFIPGSQNSIAGVGNGDFHFFLTGGKQIFDYGHWLSGMGFRVPSNSNWGTQMWYWSNQWDYEVVDHWYGLFGVNWYHWTRSAGNNYTNGLTGLDLINLPTAGVAGTDVATGVVGTKWKSNGHVEVGGGFEFPLTDRNDILRNRAYADVIFRF